MNGARAARLVPRRQCLSPCANIDSTRFCISSGATSSLCYEATAKKLDGTLSFDGPACYRKAAPRVPTNLIVW